MYKREKRGLILVKFHYGSILSGVALIYYNICSHVRLNNMHWNLISRICTLEIIVLLCSALLYKPSYVFSNVAPSFPVGWGLLFCESLLPWEGGGGAISLRIYLLYISWLRMYFFTTNIYLANNFTQLDHRGVIWVLQSACNNPCLKVKSNYKIVHKYYFNKCI